MATNGENPVEDAEMAECDGEQIVTMVDVLKEQQDFEDDANAVLGGSDEKECTYSKGYIKRQAIYACVTCCPDAKDDLMKRAGFCLACSLNCHENHDVMELYTKRNFRCDCGNPKFSKPCQFNPIKSDLNEDNIYNQNFIGLYCSCQKPYGDLESALDDEMIQCIVCEDWWHASHLDATVPPNDQYSEMICKLCMAKNEFLHDYSDLVINVENGEIDVVKVNGEHGNVNEKLTNGDITDKLSNGVEPEGTATEKKNELDSTTLIESTVCNMESEASFNTEESELREEQASILKRDITEKHENSGEDDANISSAITMETDTMTKPENSEKNMVDSEIPVENGDIEASLDITEKHENSGEDDANISSAVPMETDTLTKPENSEKNMVDSEIPVENGDIEASLDTEHCEVDKTGEASTDEINPNTTEKDNEEAAINNEEAAIDNKEAEQKSKDSDKQDESEASDEKQNDITEEKSPDSTEQISNDSVEKKDNETNLPNETDSEIKNTESSSSDEKIEDNPDISTMTETNVAKAESQTDPTNEPNTEETSQDIESNELSKDNNSVTGMEDDISSKLAENSTNITVSEISSSDENTVPEVTSAQSTVSEVTTTENKRKLSTEDIQDDVTVKKPKIDDLNCVRPKGVRKIYKGATFWPCTFRQKLCTCNECITMYRDLNVLFLIDLEDTVMEYEKLGKERTAGKLNQYEKGMEALSSLGRVQQIDALTEYNKMRDKLLNFLQNFKDRKEIVTENDIKSFFAGMKPQKRTDGVYFCG